MEFSIKITDKSAPEFLQKLREEMPAITRMCRENICLEIVKRSQSKYLTGGNPLHVRTGTLRSGMWFKLDSAGPGKDEVGDRVKYAKVHESAEIKDRTILPKKAKYLFIPLSAAAKARGRVQTRSRWVVTGSGIKKEKAKGMEWGKDFLFLKKVIMPHRPFILPSIDDTLKTNKGQDIIDKVLKREIERLQNAS